jgi:hypothetical protein
VTIIIGNPKKFALESGITRAYAHPGLRALGFFVIYIAGRCYGVRTPDATTLACSFDKLQDRIAWRGKHIASFALYPNAGVIADAYRDAIYAPNQHNAVFFGIPQSQFRDLIYNNRLVWAPNGDEAFDDWSHVLQFDVDDRVRLIAFKSKEEGYHHDPNTLKDMWLKADEFYDVLQRWRDEFEKVWAGAPKISEADYGAEEC